MEEPNNDKSQLEVHPQHRVAGKPRNPEEIERQKAPDVNNSNIHYGFGNDGRLSPSQIDPCSGGAQEAGQTEGDAQRVNQRSVSAPKDSKVSGKNRDENGSIAHVHCERSDFQEVGGHARSTGARQSQQVTGRTGHMKSSENNGNERNQQNENTKTTAAPKKRRRVTRD